MKHQQTIIIKDNCIDRNGNLLPSAVLSIFQKMAGDHAEILGVGFDNMLQKGLLWVVTQLKYQVCAKIAVGQSVCVTTWPLPPTRLGFERNYLICDETGNVLIRGVSNWMLIDTKTRRLVPSTNVYPSEEYCMDHNFAERMRRLRDFEGEFACSICAADSMVDRNGHVNNTYYADFAVQACGGLQGEVDTFQIDYLHEVMSGEDLQLYTAQSEGIVYIKGEDSEHTRKFSCAITYKG